MRTLRGLNDLSEFGGAKNSFSLLIEWVMGINFRMKILVLEGLVFMLLVT